MVDCRRRGCADLGSQSECECRNCSSVGTDCHGKYESGQRSYRNVSAHNQLGTELQSQLGIETVEGGERFEGGG